MLENTRPKARAAAGEPVYDPNNPFARILRGEVPCDKVYEDAHVLAFHDITPAAPVHVLVIPKAAYRSFHDFAGRATSEEMAALWQGVRHVAELQEVVDSGYRVITNHGADASQTVAHFHVHVLAGRPLGPLLTHDTHIR